MIKSNKLSFNEQYLLNYMKGMRIGRLQVSRECLIRGLYLRGKDKNTVPSKILIKKINRETDHDFLDGLLFYIIKETKETLSLEELELYYDRIFMLPGEEGKILKVIDIQNKTGE